MLLCLFALHGCLLSLRKLKTFLYVYHTHYSTYILTLYLQVHIHICPGAHVHLFPTF